MFLLEGIFVRSSACRDIKLLCVVSASPEAAVNGASQAAQQGEALHSGDVLV